MTFIMPLKNNYRCVHCGYDTNKPISDKKPRHGKCQISFCDQCKGGIAIIFNDDWCAIFEIKE